MDTSDYVSEVVEKALLALGGAEDKWIALLDRHADWSATCHCTMFIEPPPEQQDDFPCISFEPPILKRLLAARMQLLMSFTSHRPG